MGNNTNAVKERVIQKEYQNIEKGLIFQYMTKVMLSMKNENKPNTIIELEIIQKSTK